MLKTNKIRYFFDKKNLTVTAIVDGTEFDAIIDCAKDICGGDISIAVLKIASMSRKYRMQNKFIGIAKYDKDEKNLDTAMQIATRRLYHAYDKDYHRCLSELRLNLESAVEKIKERESRVEGYLDSYALFKAERRLHEKAKTLSDNPSVKSPTQIFCENVNECMKEINTTINNHINTEINNHKEENPTLEMKAKGEMKDESADKKVDASMLAFEVLAVTIRKSDRSIVNSDSLYELYVALMCTLNMPYITRVEFTHKMITRVFIDSPFAVGYVCDDKSVIFKGIELCKLGFLNYVWSKKLSDEDKRRIEALWDHVYVRDTAKLPSTFDASRAIPVNKIYYSLYTNKSNPSRLSVPNKDLLDMTFSEVIESIFKNDKFIKGI